MADLQVGRFGRLVQALGNLKTPHTLGQLLPDVLPVLDIESPRPESELFSGNQLFAGSQVVAAVAAQFSGVGLQMDAAGRVAIVDRIWITSAASAAQYRIGFASSYGTASATSTAQPTDNRLTGLASSTLRNANTAAAPILTSNWIWSAVVGGNATLEVPLDIILTRPRALIVECQSANIGCHVSFRWRERNLGSQEATP